MNLQIYPLPQDWNWNFFSEGRFFSKGRFESDDVPLPQDQNWNFFPKVDLSQTMSAPPPRNEKLEIW